LHRTLNQRRFACWFRAGEGRRSAAYVVALGDDAKHYQIRAVKFAIEESKS
jgi:hypothetical protein